MSKCRTDNPNYHRTPDWNFTDADEREQEQRLIYEEQERIEYERYEAEEQLRGKNFNVLKDAYQAGFIDELTYSELQVQTPEWKELKNG